MNSNGFVIIHILTINMLLCFHPTIISEKMVTPTVRVEYDLSTKGIHF